MKEALYYEILENGSVKCRLCPHNCIIKQDRTGICGVRENISSKLVSNIYQSVTSIGMDPIEKKPLYHFYPSKEILSIGTKGCNLKCPFCQNWQISQDLSVKTDEYPSDKIVKIAIDNNSIGIAYTYSEPVIWFEYVMETAEIARSNNLKNVMVTNGFINSSPLKDLLKYIDAMNIDLKTFHNETFRKIHNGKLENVKETIKIAYDNGCHIELTTLIVTGINDTISEMEEIIEFIKSIDENIPWHISRYFPSYNYNEKATDIDFIMKVYDMAVKSLNFVYTGNIHSPGESNNTYCYNCGELIINRNGYNTSVQNLKDGSCGKCGTKLNVIHK